MIRWPITRYAVTGATGTLGGAVIRRLLADGAAERIVALSRDEVKLGDLAEALEYDDRMRFMLGDVRDRERLEDVFHGCQVVIHGAALKRVQAVAYSPYEAVKTNVNGTINVIQAAVAAGVERVIVVSSDKAVEPINHYGTTKAAAETCAVQANSYTFPRGTRVACVRYGNVLGSRGSVLRVWHQQFARSGRITITDPAMTRFLITVEQAAVFVLDAAYDLRGGEVFVPILPACSVGALALAFLTTHGVAADPLASVLTTGRRPGGEKDHERLLNIDEAAHRTQLHQGRYLVTPTHREWSAEPYPGEPVDFKGAPYDSLTALHLTPKELHDLIQEVAP